MKVPLLASPEPEESRMPLLEHLKELRYRVMVSLGALFAGSLGGLAFATDVYEFLKAPIQSVYSEHPHNRWDHLYAWLTSPLAPALPDVHVEGALTLANSPLEGMSSFFQVGMIFGTIVVSPIVAWQVWRFIAPALYSKERRAVIPLVASSTVLFVSGALFCYAVILPFALPYMLTILEARADTSVSAYLGFVVRMMIGLGLCFQLPIVSWFLARVGLIDHKDLIKYFRYAVVALFVVAAIVTPDTNPITQVLMVLPLLTLYCIGIVVAYFATTKVRTD